VGGDYSGDPTTETGGMHSWMIEPGGGGGPLFRTLLDAGQPISKAPSLSVDENGDRWVHFGTGRVYTGLDMIQEHQESMYGVKEPRDASGNYTHGTVLKANLQNITGIEVFSDSTLNVPGGLGIPVAVDTYAELDNYIEENKDGWYRNHYVNAGDPSGRVVTEPVRISTLLLYTDFIPSEDRCDALGVSNLYAVSFKTGTAYPFGALGFDTTSYPGSELALDNIEFAKGLVSSIVIHQGAETDGVTVIGQSSTGALPSEVVKLPPTRTGRQSWREITKFY
jgi:type IV pilus assembly protein PilY1